MRIYLCLLACVVTQISFALHLNPTISLISGVSAAKIGETVTSPVIDSSQYNYGANHSYIYSGLLGLFAGARANLSNAWEIESGLAYYQPQSFHVRGLLTQGADAQSADQFNYRYRVISRQLLFENKFLYCFSNQVKPFFNIGLGATGNTAYNFAVDYPRFLTFTPFYNNHTTYSFSYHLGLGIDIKASRQIHVGVGYQFTDLGEVKLGNGHIDVVPVSSVIHQSHLYSHQIVAQLTYVLT